MPAHFRLNSFPIAGFRIICRYCFSLAPPSVSLFVDQYLQAHFYTDHQYVATIPHSKAERLEFHHALLADAAVPNSQETAHWSPTPLHRPMLQSQVATYSAPSMMPGGHKAITLRIDTPLDWASAPESQSGGTAEVFRTSDCLCR